MHAAALAHYSVAADVVRMADPNMQYTVESTIRQTQNIAIKGPQTHPLRGTNSQAGQSSHFRNLKWSGEGRQVRVPAPTSCMSEIC